MPVFLVTPLGHNADQIGQAVRGVVPAEDVLELQGRSGFLVSFPGTSVDLSHKIGITSPDREQPTTLGSAMVTTVGAYYGRGPTTMWEWLKLKFERL